MQSILHNLKYCITNLYSILSGADYLSGHVKTSLVFIKDSLQQFLTMNIEEDYMRCQDGGDHKKREVLRLQVVVKRLLFCLQKLEGLDVHNLVAECLYLFQKAECSIIDSSSTRDEVAHIYACLEQSVKLVLQNIKPMCPKHRPIDIQTSDAALE